MLSSEDAARRIVESANIGKNDNVLEIGTGEGVITKYLGTVAGRLVSYEIDSVLGMRSQEYFAKSPNVEVRLGDAFDRNNDFRFDICVTSLPYSESLNFIRWLSMKAATFKRSVAVLQSEFVKKITSPSGSKSYRAVSVIAQESFQIEELFSIGKNEFRPPPTVSSAVVRLTPRKDVPQPFFTRRRLMLLSHLFSFRGRLVSAALRKMDLKATPSQNLGNKRIENLTPLQFLELIADVEACVS